MHRNIAYVEAIATARARATPTITRQTNLVAINNTMSILERVRASGKCPPSLLCDDTNGDFVANATKVVDANGTSVVRQ